MVDIVDPYKDLEDSVEELITPPKKDRGFLGYSPGNVYSVIVAGESDKYWVRTTAGSFIKALHKGRTAPVPNLEVVLDKDEFGNTYIFELVPSSTGAAGGIYAGNLYTGLHSHEWGSGMEFPINFRLVVGLKTEINTTFTVNIRPGFYSYQNELKYFTGYSNYSVNGLIPTTSNMGKWILIGVNPVTELPVSVASGDLVPDGNDNLDVAEIINITGFFENGYIASAAVAVIEGDTGLIELNFVDLRHINTSAIGDLKTVLVSADDTTEGYLEDKIVAGANISIAVLNDGANELLEISATLSEVGQTLFTSEGDLTVSQSPFKIYNNFGVTKTISEVFLSVATAPTGSAIIVDIHKNGTTIFTTQANRPQIAIAATTGFTTTIDVPSWDDGDYLEMHIDQIGSGVAGSDLVVHVVYS